MLHGGIIMYPQQPCENNNNNQTCKDRGERALRRCEDIVSVHKTACFVTSPKQSI